MAPRSTGTGASDLVVRWPDRRDTPLTVWIQTRPAAEDDSGVIDGVREAFLTWGRVGLPIAFRFVDDSAAAEVHVSWVDRFRAPISGRTVWSFDQNGWIVEASIQLSVHHRDGDPLDARSTRALALHEIGHLLGLRHSDTPTSIMAPLVQVEELSDEDTGAALALYSRLPDVRGAKVIARR